MSLATLGSAQNFFVYFPSEGPEVGEPSVEVTLTEIYKDICVRIPAGKSSLARNEIMLLCYYVNEFLNRKANPE